MALRQTADRVDAQMREYRDEKSIAPVWAAGERIVVGIGPGPPWRTARSRREAACRRDRCALARGVRRDAAGAAPSAVGAQSHPRLFAAGGAARRARRPCCQGASVADELIAFAVIEQRDQVADRTPAEAGMAALARRVGGRRRDRAAARRRSADHRQRRRRAAAARLCRSAGADQGPSRHRRIQTPIAQAALARVRGRGAASARVATALAWALFGRFEATNLVMVYLARCPGRGLSLSGAARRSRRRCFRLRCSTSCLFRRITASRSSDSQYLLTFAVMLAVGVVISNLTASVRLQARVAQHRQMRTEALYTMTRELSRASSLDDVVTPRRPACVDGIPGAGGGAAAGRVRNDHAIRPPPGIYGSFHGADLGIARWVNANRVAAGLGHAHLGRRRRPVSSARGSAPGRRRAGGAAQRGLNACSFPSSAICSKPSRVRSPSALERVQLASERAELARKAEAESVRNSLLNAISHDLRTPLAVLVGASSSLDRGPGAL